jgi:plastocyanin
MRVYLSSAVALALLVQLPRPSYAQSVTERSPNLGGTWLAEAGTIHFNFVHRFNTSPAPERKVLNSPTFVVTTRTPLRTMVGFAYATNSDIVQGIPNEWELFGRFVPRLDADGRTNVGLQLAWNAAALSADGDLTAGRVLGPLRLLGTFRAFSNAFDAGERRMAAGGGAALQLTRWLALSGDAVSLLERRADERIAWSGGIQLGIPGTPHSMSIHGSNTNTTTLEGLSRGSSTVRYGFEYTVPIHLARFRDGKRAARAASAPDHMPEGSPEAAAIATGDTVQVSIKNLAFGQKRIEVTQGTVIVWTNKDPLTHTVTAAGDVFDSGEIFSGASWAHRFDEPGTFEVSCDPHPFMRTTVVVRQR